jgi:formylglycine-generating enzyme required for sulfatase activity
LSVTAEQHALIAANAPALIRSDAERTWWQQCDAWFALTERIGRNPYEGFRALLELTEQDETDWARLHVRLRSVGVTGALFWEGPWNVKANWGAAQILRVIDKIWPAFLTQPEMFRAMNYALEELKRRERVVAVHSRDLSCALRAAFVQQKGAAQLPPLFRGDAFFLPDEPLLGFEEVPAGPFLMGSDRSRDPEAEENEMWPGTASGQALVGLPSYYIARYTVTVAQFRMFVESAGFELDNDDGLKREPEHPFVVVTWSEALAYCRWLERVLAESAAVPGAIKDLLAAGYRVHLPSEAEWEKAARGTDGRIFPCGDTLDPGQANYVETRLGKATPVGSFPAGASPYGILDMSGNVWEWTRSLLIPYPYDPADGREDPSASGPRVVRGGSWSRIAQNARAAFRNVFDPVYRLNFTQGFRIVLSRVGS